MNCLALKSKNSKPLAERLWRSIPW